MRVDALRGAWDSDVNCKNKRIDALRGRWTMIGIAKKSAKIREFMHYGTGGHRLELQKKKCKNKRVDALKDRWPMVGIAKRVQKLEGLCIKGRVTNDINCPKKCKNKRVYVLRGGGGGQ